MMAKRFRVNVVVQLLHLIVEVLVFAYFLPMGVYRFDAHLMDVTTFVFLIVFLVFIGVFLAFLALFYTIEIDDSRLTVKAVFVLTRVDIGSIRYVQQIGEILPLYVFGVDRGIAGQTVRYVYAVRPERDFMATLKLRNRAIRFSKRNEERIAVYLSKERK